MSNFIPKQYKKEAFTIRIDIEKLEKIDKLAAKYDLSRNRFIDQCIDYAIDHMQNTEKETAEE